MFDLELLSLLRAEKEYETLVEAITQSLPADPLEMEAQQRLPLVHILLETASQPGLFARSIVLLSHILKKQGEEALTLEASDRELAFDFVNYQFDDFMKVEVTYSSVLREFIQVLNTQIDEYCRVDSCEDDDVEYMRAIAVYLAEQIPADELAPVFNYCEKILSGREKNHEFAAAFLLRIYEKFPTEFKTAFQDKLALLAQDSILFAEQNKTLVWTSLAEFIFRQLATKEILDQISMELQHMIYDIKPLMAQLSLRENKFPQAVQQWADGYLFKKPALPKKRKRSADSAPNDLPLQKIEELFVEVETIVRSAETPDEELERLQYLLCDFAGIPPWFEKATRLLSEIYTQEVDEENLCVLRFKNIFHFQNELIHSSVKLRMLAELMQSSNENAQHLAMHILEHIFPAQDKAYDIFLLKAMRALIRKNESDYSIRKVCDLIEASYDYLSSTYMGQEDFLAMMQWLKTRGSKGIEGNKEDEEDSDLICAAMSSNGVDTPGVPLAPFLLTAWPRSYQTTTYAGAYRECALTFREEIVAGDGDCAFTALDASRDEVHAILLSLAEDPVVRERFKPEMRELFISEYMRKGPEEGDPLFIKQKNLFELQKQIDQLQSNLADRYSQLQGLNLEQRMAQLPALPEDKEKDKLTALYQEASIIEQAFDAHFSGQTAYEDYINKMGDRTWGSIMALIQYAETMQKGLCVWMLDNKREGELVLNAYTGDPLAADTRHVIFKPSQHKADHFDLLKCTERKLIAEDKAQPTPAP